MDARKDTYMLFSECEFCGEKVPVKMYCSECGKRQRRKIELQIVSHTKQKTCGYCGSVVLKGNNCFSCGFELQKFSF